jgi:F-type H+-transporting ATPase subunit b
MAEETHAGTEAPGGHNSEPSALGLDATMWVSLAMLLVTVLLVWKRVPAAIGKSLDAKIDTIRNQLAEAETLRKEAEGLKAEYQAKASAAESDAAAIIERARHEAEAIVAKAGEDAEALIERRGRMAEDKIAAEERAALAELRSAAAQAAAKAAARIIAERNDPSTDSRLVDQAIAGLGKTH